MYSTTAFWALTKSSYTARRLASVALPIFSAAGDRYSCSRA